MWGNPLTTVYALHRPSGVGDELPSFLEQSPCEGALRLRRLQGSCCLLCSGNQDPGTKKITFKLNRCCWKRRGGEGKSGSLRERLHCPLGCCSLLSGHRRPLDSDFLEHLQLGIRLGVLEWSRRGDLLLPLYDLFCRFWLYIRTLRAESQRPCRSLVQRLRSTGFLPPSPLCAVRNPMVLGQCTANPVAVLLGTLITKKGKKIV